MNNINQKILPIYNSVFNEAKRTAKNLRLSKQRLSSHLPFSNIDLNDSDILDRLDAFRARFTDLQDILGRKVFGSILLLEAEEKGSMIDILNQMEKRLIINDVTEWIAVRELRNKFTHDYPEDESSRLQALQRGYDKIDYLLNIVNTVDEYVNKRMASE